MSLRGRSILVGIIVVLMAYLAVPSFFSQEQRDASPFLRDRAVRLGLDLQGGIHWLLRVDDQVAFRQEADSIKGAVEALATERGIELTAAEVSEEGSIELSGDGAALKALLDEQFRDIDVAQNNGSLQIELSSQRRQTVLKTAVDQSLEVLDRRINGLGVTEPVIAPQGEGRILVQMPGGEVDPATARKMLDRTTFLVFHKVEAFAANEELLEAQYPDGLPADTKIVVELLDSGDPNSVTEALLVPSDPVLTGLMLQDARIGFDRRNRPIILFTWNAEGTRIFREFTGNNIGNRLASIIDGKVITAPTIQGRIGRNGQITGSFTREEAANIAVSLRSGALPVPLKIEEERTVGPQLGADSVSQGAQSILLGGAFVIVFMLIYYNKSGLLANTALIVNLTIIIGLMSLAEATLTLPGIAGLVLTVGMAVDANVIIFERIREELRTNKNTRNAIQIGFKRSALTIMDANVTTLIAAIVLLYFGRGPVQGFGVTLAIGIISSVFCALVVTRLLFDLAYTRNPQTLRI